MDMLRERLNRLFVIAELECGDVLRRKFHPASQCRLFASDVSCSQLCNKKGVDRNRVNEIYTYPFGHTEMLKEASEYARCLLQVLRGSKPKRGGLGRDKGPGGTQPLKWSCNKN